VTQVTERPIPRGSDAEQRRPPPPPPTPQGRDGRGQPGERARSERRLGLLLSAPAVIVMVAVTGYPIGYAIYLSLQRADLRFPDQNEFVGLRNYVDVLTSELWWTDLSTTMTITIITVTLELVFGMAIAVVLHRAIVGRGLVRATILVPYAMITVVAAIAFQFAFTPGIGFVNEWFDSDRAWLTERPSALFVIILTEVWKTTPFMALLPAQPRDRVRGLGADLRVRDRDRVRVREGLRHEPGTAAR
jgi:multiple sugar transport system permease protein